MSIDWFRDLIISISGIVLIVLLILVAVLSYSLYRRAKSILDSVKTTARSIQGISSYVGDEVVKPVTQVVALIQGVRQGIDAISKLFKKQGGGKNG
jgi:hypothetical protein